MEINYINLSKPYDLSEILNNSPIMEELYLAFTESEEFDLCNKLSYNEYSIYFSNYLEILSRFLLVPDNYILNCKLLKDFLMDADVDFTLIYSTQLIILNTTNPHVKQIKYFHKYFNPSKANSLPTKTLKPETATEKKLIKTFVNRYTLIEKVITEENIAKLRVFFDAEFERVSTIMMNQIRPSIRLKKLQIKNTERSPAEIIFRDDKEELYKFIVDKYPRTKNAAFFSYLYHFFSDNKFLLKNLKSSVEYNKYIVSNNLIDKFSKVIQRNTDNSDEEKRMFEIFQKLSNDFYSK